MYDFAHCLSDYIEGITHSLCTLEFEVHRPLYDWILESLDLPRALPRQIEFARLNIDYTVISKRKLLQLVNDGSVNGWDDPRMPTLSGMRRRGITASAIRAVRDRTRRDEISEPDRIQRPRARRARRSSTRSRNGGSPCCDRSKSCSRIIRPIRSKN